MSFDSMSTGPRWDTDDVVYWLLVAVSLLLTILAVAVVSMSLLA